MARESERLSEFVRASAGQGHDRATIAGALAEAGWSEAEADAALNAWAETSQGLLAPRPGAVVTAKEFLFYGVLFGALLLTGIYAVLVMVQGIDVLFEEEVRPWRLDGLRFYIAAVIVSTPIYLWLTRIDLRQSAEARARSGIRRWMAAILLLIAAFTLVGDLIWVIYRFLDGALSVPTLLKAVSIAIVAGGAFAFYRREVETEQ